MEVPLHGDGGDGTTSPRLGLPPSPAGSLTAGPAAGQDAAAARRAGRLFKRPSVDSGINLASVDSIKRTSLDSGLDVLHKYTR